MCRPGYGVTEGGLVVLGSGVGVRERDQATVVRKGGRQPGRMFLVDTAQGRIVEDEEIKRSLAEAQPYEDWIHDGLIRLEDLPARFLLTPQHSSVVKHQRVFGYNSEELKIQIGRAACRERECQYV